METESEKMRGIFKPLSCAHCLMSSQKPVDLLSITINGLFIIYQFGSAPGQQQDRFSPPREWRLSAARAAPSGSAGPAVAPGCAHAPPSSNGVGRLLRHDASGSFAGRRKVTRRPQPSKRCSWQNSGIHRPPDAREQFHSKRTARYASKYSLPAFPHWIGRRMRQTKQTGKLR